MSDSETIATAPHEVDMFWWFTEHGLSPYWALGEICLGAPLEGHHELDMDLAADDADPEVWHVRLNYSQGGLAPRPSDPVDSDTLYEFRLHLEGPGEAKADFHIRPRFDDMTKASNGESASIPWCGGEGVDVHVQGSNLELTEYRYLLQKALQELADAAGTDFSRRYFNHIRSDSKIATFERYVRLKREYGEKLTRADGLFLRLMHLAADLDDAEWVYSGNNEDGIPKRHAFDVDPTTAAQLVAGHSLGKRLKCYHPKYVRSEESDDDPLSSPTLRAAFHKSLQEEAVRWGDRDELVHELEEIVVNLLRWAGIPTTPDVTAFVEDDHFSVCPSERSVGRFEDPTPALEAEQDQLLVTTLGDLTDNGEALLKTLATDGGQHVEEAADEIGASTRTVYRAVDALGELVDLDNGLLQLTSEKIRQDVAALVESLESFASSTASAIARLCKVETRSAADSALQRWMHKYGVEFLEEAPGDAEGTIRFDTVLSSLKFDDRPELSEVLREGLEAWTKTGRDAVRFNSLHYEAEVLGGRDLDAGLVGTAVG